ncbi:MAG: phosphodiester glycosidase family protein, partial [bacterium]
LFFDTLKVGDKIVISVTAYPDMSDVVSGMTAGPLLIRNGAVQKSLIEDFTVTSGIVAKRNPRTAAGHTKNNHLLFVVVEGRTTRSAGMSLAELAELMSSLGSVNAINLDGGGSSEIVINNKIMNDISEGRERPLANAFLINYK